MIEEKSMEALRSIINCADVCEDVLGLPVYKKNGKAFILCPFHNDNHPSCQVNQSFVYCYSCHHSADAIDLICKVNSCEWWDAVKALQKYYGVELEEGKKTDCRPVIVLKSEALHLVGIEEKQLLKQLYVENPIYFWRYLKEREHEFYAALLKTEKVLPKERNITKEIETRKKELEEFRKFIDFGSSQKPNNYILKIN